MKVERDISLRKYTTLHVGGPANYFIRVQNDTDAVEAIAIAHQLQLPFFVLGKGSNTLFPDKGFSGVILHMEDRTIKRLENQIIASSGLFMRQLVNFALDNNLRGLEELAGIPGTVGGAVRGNAGTWSTETKDYLTTVDVLEVTNGTSQIRTLLAAECNFGYRHSIFKQHPNWIILRATFVLPEGNREEGQALVQKDLTTRHEKQPYDASSAGSIFKNPDKANKIFSGQLIEMAGLKGKQYGGAAISNKHANFIINSGSATSSDILHLIKLAQSTVLQNSGQHLYPEIEIVP